MSKYELSGEKRRIRVYDTTKSYKELAGMEFDAVINSLKLAFFMHPTRNAMICMPSEDYMEVNKKPTATAGPTGIPKTPTEENPRSMGGRIPYMGSFNYLTGAQREKYEEMSGDPELERIVNMLFEDIFKPIKKEMEKVLDNIGCPCELCTAKREAAKETGDYADKYLVGVILGTKIPVFNKNDGKGYYVKGEHTEEAKKHGSTLDARKPIAYGVDFAKPGSDYTGFMTFGPGSDNYSFARYGKTLAGKTWLLDQQLKLARDEAEAAYYRANPFGWFADFFKSPIDPVKDGHHRRLVDEMLNYKPKKEITEETAHKFIKSISSDTWLVRQLKECREYLANQAKGFEMRGQATPQLLRDEMNVVEGALNKLSPVNTLKSELEPMKWEPGMYSGGAKVQWKHIIYELVDDRFESHLPPDEANEIPVGHKNWKIVGYIPKSL